MKITINELKHYLGTGLVGLNVKDLREIGEGEIAYDGGFFKIAEINRTTNRVWWSLILNNSAILGASEGSHGVKPILYPLSMLTEAIRKEINNSFNCGGAFLNGFTKNTVEFESGYEEKITVGEMVKTIEILCANHFDIFGWIDKGLAIDATKLETNPYE